MTRLAKEQKKYEAESKPFSTQISRMFIPEWISRQKYTYPNQDPLPELKSKDYNAITEYFIEIMKKKAGEIDSDGSNTERLEKAIADTKEAIRYFLFMESPNKRPVLTKGETFILNHALVNGISVACRRGKVFPYEAVMDLKADDMANPFFEIDRQREYIIDSELICKGLKKLSFK